MNRIGAMAVVVGMAVGSIACGGKVASVSDPDPEPIVIVEPPPQPVPPSPRPNPTPAPKPAPKPATTTTRPAPAPVPTPTPSTEPVSPPPPCVPSTFYRDDDGDGWGVDGDTVTACDQPAGFARKSGDCFDANADARPDQKKFFTVDRGDGSFDYDCSGDTALEEAQVDPGFCLCGGIAGGAISCGTTSGWESAVPGCGETSTWIAGSGGGLTCETQPGPKTQGCH